MTPPPHPQAFQAPSPEEIQGDDPDIDPTSKILYVFGLCLVYVSFIFSFYLVYV